MKTAEAEEKVAKEAGRGVIFIAFAKLYFMVAGAVIEFRLPAILGNVTFGAYGVVSSLISPINNVLIVGTIQSVARFTAQSPERARQIQAAGLRMHLFVGLPIAAGFAALSPLLGAFFHDAQKSGPIALGALVLAGYSFYAVFVGRANGTRRFATQAGLDISFATLRCAGILGLASAGLGLIGAISGWALAVAAILLVSSFAVGTPSGQKAVPMRPLLLFFAGVALYLVLMNFIMVVDQLLLKRLSTEWFVANAEASSRFVTTHLPSWLSDRVGQIRPADAADAQVGYYRAVQNLARLSYQAIIAATFVIFPLISRATFVEDTERTHRYIQTTVRMALLVASAIAVVFASSPHALLDIPYPVDYADTGKYALAVLAMGNVCFAILVICGTILNGAGDTRRALWSVGITLVATVAANWAVIPLFPPGPQLLAACACATSACMGLGMILSLLLLRYSFSVPLPVATFLRVAISAALCIALGAFWPSAGIAGTMLKSCAIGLLFLGILGILGEFRRSELAQIAAILGRKKASRSDS